MMVTVSGLSGDTKAYRSVLSAVGSWEISGATAWLEAFACFGCRLLAVRPTPSAAATASPAASGLRGLKTGAPPHSSPWGDAGALCSAERAERFDRSEDSPDRRATRDASLRAPEAHHQRHLAVRGQHAAGLRPLRLDLPAGRRLRGLVADLADDAVGRVQRHPGRCERHAEGARDDARRRRERVLCGSRDLTDLALGGRAGVGEAQPHGSARRDVAGVLQP